MSINVTLPTTLADLADNLANVATLAAAVAVVVALVVVAVMCLPSVLRAASTRTETKADEKNQFLVDRRRRERRGSMILKA